MSNTTYQSNFNELARRAIPLSEEDWGSERQTEAENEFFIQAEKVLSPEVFANLETYCLHATTEEGIAATMTLLYPEKEFMEWLVEFKW
jgi:hypothetical protein